MAESSRVQNLLWRTHSRIRVIRRMGILLEDEPGALESARSRLDFSLAFDGVDNAVESPVSNVAADRVELFSMFLVCLGHSRPTVVRPGPDQDVVLM